MFTAQSTDAAQRLANPPREGFKNWGVLVNKRVKSSISQYFASSEEGRLT